MQQPRVNALFKNQECRGIFDGWYGGGEGGVEGEMDKFMYTIMQFRRYDEVGPGLLAY